MAATPRRFAGERIPFSTAPLYSPIIRINPLRHVARYEDRRSNVKSRIV